MKLKFTTQTLSHKELQMLQYIQLMLKQKHQDIVAIYCEFKNIRRCSDEDILLDEDFRKFLISEFEEIENEKNNFIKQY